MYCSKAAHHYLAFRYKSICIFLGKQFRVYWLYFNKAFIFLKMSTYIKMYLYHEILHIALAKLLVKFKGLFCCLFKLYLKTLLFVKYICIQLGPYKLGVTNRRGVFSIELAYVHSVFYRLFVGLMSINPILLLISLCLSKLVFEHSFYYEYSGLSYKFKGRMYISRMVAI